MSSNVKIRWRWGMMAATAITLLSLYPQALLWIAHGRNWQGAYAYIDTDEVAYSAYINALIGGRPRRNDPYTGRDDRAHASQPESLFSIQFAPAYTMAIPARALGLSASTIFIVLIIISAFASSLAVFWLIAMLTNDERLAATGVIVVLCLGVLISAQGVLRERLGLEAAYGYLPFLRRYIPAASFPFYFVLCGCVWRALTCEDKRAALKSAVVAGVIFALLIFSYFYLWTAAAAWLACLTLLWLVARPENYRRVVWLLGVIGVFAVAVLLPYFFLLSNRGATMDTVQALAFSRAPDLSSPPELIGIMVFATLALGSWRGIIKRKDRAVLFAASFALMPVVVFNQQVITGRSLQPTHYEEFIANYVVLLAAVVAAALMWRQRAGAARKVPGRVLVWLALAAFEWGVIETVSSARVLAEYNLLRDDAMPVAVRLADLIRDPRTIVLVRDPQVADSLPTVAPLSLLWSPHMHVFAGITLAENKERFYQYLYYTGVDEQLLAKALTEKSFTARLALFGWERANTKLAVNPQPITPEDERKEVLSYAEYIASFTRERAANPTLSYVVTMEGDEAHLSNLDRWYQRDAGERFGKFTLYRVKLRDD